jgi:phosphoribosylglycinamide formyltransferase 1
LLNQNNPLKKIAVFASGSGSNAEKIFEYFQDHPLARVELLLTNRKDAYVIERAKKFNIPIEVFDRYKFYESDDILKILKDKDISLIVLAGFLWLVPKNLVDNYQAKIINIHPALLPKYGGKGMYGLNVHKAVIDAKEEESGITIHLVNDHYDEGDIIFKKSCAIESSDTPEEVAKKVQILEHKYYPLIIEEMIKKQ